MGGAIMMGNVKATQFKVFVKNNWDRPQRKGGYNTPPPLSSSGRPGALRRGGTRPYFKNPG